MLVDAKRLCSFDRFKLLTPAMGLNWADSGICLGASGFGVNVWVSFLWDC